MNTRYSHDEWMAIFRQRSLSGLSIRKWCERNDCKYDTYKYWQKKFQKMGADSDSASEALPVFAELPRSSYTISPPVTASSIQISYNGFRIEIGQSSDLNQLAGVLRLLQSLC